MNILIIDNYDSFTFNLYQYCGEILNKYFISDQFKVIVKRNDELSLESIKKLNANKIIISPGPGSPENKDYFGICSDVILKMGPQIPILGICLGMQGMCYSFGGKVIKAKEPMHGKTSFLIHDGIGLHAKIPQNIEIMRYHSLIVDKNSLPKCFKINGISHDGNNLDSTLDSKDIPFESEIMAISHKKYPIYGIQYHPESFGSEGGKEIIGNFLINF